MPGQPRHLFLHSTWWRPLPPCRPLVAVGGGWRKVILAAGPCLVNRHALCFLCFDLQT